MWRKELKTCYRLTSNKTQNGKDGFLGGELKEICKEWKKTEKQMSCFFLKFSCLLSSFNISQIQRGTGKIKLADSFLYLLQNSVLKNSFKGKVPGVLTWNCFENNLTGWQGERQKERGVGEGDCFEFFAITNGVAAYIFVHVPLRICVKISLEQIPRKRSAGSQCLYILNFIRYLQIAFKSSFTIYTS